MIYQPFGFIGSLNLELGQLYQGGILVAYDSTTGEGLIAARNDISASNQQWENQPYTSLGILVDTYGFGQTNTSVIINNAPSPPAAVLCANFSDLGYDDWFLPSVNELQYVRTAYQNGLITNAFNAPYWSSSSTEFNTARCIVFGDNPFVNNIKTEFRDSSQRIRPCRYVT